MPPYLIRARTSIFIMATAVLHTICLLFIVDPNGTQMSGQWYTKTKIYKNKQQKSTIKNQK